MRVISADELGNVLDYASLIEHIREMFSVECTVPVRHHHSIAIENQPEATLLLMPAWRTGAFIGVKVATIFPGNVARALPSVNATYMVLDGETGAPLALMDGAELTARRTAAASALASRYLSRADSAHHLMVGTGTLAPHLIRAHAVVRPIESVSIWGRTPEKAERLAESLAGSRSRSARWRASKTASARPISSPAPPSPSSRLCSANGCARASTWTWSAPIAPTCANPTTKSFAGHGSSSIPAAARSSKGVTW